MKKILYLIIFSFILFVVLKFSTFGWRLWGKQFMDYTEKNNLLAKRLESHVYRLAHQIGDRSIFNYDKLERAADYITKELESFNYSVEFQPHSAYGKKAKNIIATKEGREQEVVVIGAHYDSCFNPGADDNASGIAALLELANLFSGKESRRTIKFIAFVNEEPPFFKTENMGSRVYAKDARAKGEDIKAVLIMETIGYYSNEPNSQNYPPFLGLFYPNKGNFICVVGNFASGSLVKQAVSVFKKNTQFPIESFVGPSFVAGVDFSDHWSFWQEGYPAVMITDTAFYRNRNYHTKLDTYDTLDYSSIAEVVKGFSAVLSELIK